MNASPDLATQIQANPDLQPLPNAGRNSPISTVLLTNADLDHVLGLFSLREGKTLHVHALQSVRAIVDGCLSLSRVLGAFCGVTWHELPFGDFVFLDGDGRESGSLQYRALALPGAPPAFAKEMPAGEVHSVAFQFFDPETGGRLLVAPDVAGANEDLLKALGDSDAVLFDGTFWSNDELSSLKPAARTADQMGHITIERSLELLRGSRAKKKAYIHVNNTNPILAAESKARAAVEGSGIEVARDGMEFEL